MQVERVSSPAPVSRTVGNWTETGTRDHFVQFYRTDDYLIECLASYVAKGLGAREKVIVIATPAHRLALEERLRMKRIDVASNLAFGRYLALDAEEMLGKFMVAGSPDRPLFRQTVGEIVRHASADGTPLRAFGEMVALLWSDDNREGAVALEQLWNELAGEYAFALFCAYPAERMTPQAGRPAIEHVCQAHSCVIPFTAA